jgi:hypothetical protein
MVNNKIDKKKDKVFEDNSSGIEWTTKDDNKLLALYKRNVPEFALSKILKKSLPEIRKRILKLLA